MERKEQKPGSIPRGILEAISGIKKPTCEQQLIIDELTQTTTPELGPILAKELAETTERGTTK